MPRPVDRNATYFAGLDGVRTLAVALVIAYHLGISQAQGGLLGVGVFFTLSGFLITSILLSGWQRNGHLGLKMFWIRRARRLLPAVVLVLLTSMVVVLMLDPSHIGKRAGQALAALFYVANWHTVAAGQSYFDRFAAPGPFDHLWSLSVEEQFYLCWPLLLAGIVAICRGSHKMAAAITAALAVTSFALLALLSSPGFDNTRAYEGTDTRAGGLLLGAALALVWRPSGSAQPASLRRRTLADVAGVAGIVGIIALVMTTDEHTMSLYQWGLLVLSLSTLALLYAVCTRGTVLAGFFGLTPLRWLGERSYGIYLWHLPVMVFTPAQFLSGASWLRNAVMVAVTVALSALSWSLIEDPIRRHGLAGAIRQAWQGATTRHRPGVIYGTATFVPLAILSMLVPQVVADAATPAGSRAATGADSAVGGNSASNGTVKGLAAPKPKQAAAEHKAVHSGALQTKCTSVIHIGDSTSEGLMSAEYLPNPADREDAQLKSVGVTTFYPEISGARSIIETWGGHANAQTVAKDHLAKGYKGCWILALGTNDAANLYTGGADYQTRIDQMMQTIPADQPVLWVNTKTLVKSGYYSAQHNVDWDNALVTASKRYPNMRIYDWASEVADSWFINDNIHFNSPGYQQRAKRIARALAIAFPKTGSSPAGVLISSK